MALIALLTVIAWFWMATFPVLMLKTSKLVCVHANPTINVDSLGTQHKD